MQVKLINEHRLNVLEPEHYDLLVREMGNYLGLRDDMEEARDE